MGGGFLKAKRGIILKMAARTDAIEIQELSMWKNVTNLHAIGWNVEHNTI